MEEAHLSEVDPGEGDPCGGIKGRQQAVPQVCRKPQQAAIILRQNCSIARQQHMRRQQPACTIPL
jgi:hypothetical protein